MIFISDVELARRFKKRMQMSPCEQDGLDLDMLYAAEQGNRRDMEAYLMQGAHPDACDVKGNRGLFLAEEPGCVLGLLEARADRFATNRAGVLPLVHHIERGNEVIVRILQQGVSPLLLDKVRKAAIDAGLRAGPKGIAMTRDFVWQTYLLKRRLGSETRNTL